jgi:hypothetical protein
MELKVVTRRAPSAQELADLTFAFRICKHVKSNAIVYAKQGATVGIGAGQMSRVDSSRIAAWKAAEAAKAERAAAKAEREAAKANTVTKTAEERAAAKAEREARLAALNSDGTRKYTGPMLALADRVKQGAYVKAATGQLRSTNELAEMLDAVPVDNVIALAKEVLGLDHNPYSALNPGQQSMNLRNRMRGAIKKGTLTLDAIKAVIDANGYDTATGWAEAKAKAKADREAKAAEAKAAKAAKEATAAKVEGEAIAA